MRQGRSQRLARSQCDRINFQRAGHNVAAKVCPLALNNWETALRNTKHLTSETPAQGTTRNIWGHRSGAIYNLPLTSSPKVHVPLLQSLTSKNCYVQISSEKAAIVLFTTSAAQENWVMLTSGSCSSWTYLFKKYLFLDLWYVSNNDKHNMCQVPS